MLKPELLSPAGTLKNMHYAFAYGADAVYAGLPRYSLRVRNNDFNLEHLAQGIDKAKALGKNLYVVTNIAPHNSKLKTFIKDIEPIVNLKPDALIMSDPGLIMLVKEAFPDQNIHLSVQANAVNWASVKFWKNQGISRIILSRELALEEIKEIRDNCLDVELEVFVHGALCMAYSGRCLLSGYLNKRDPNQGACTNACRWNYNLHGATENSNSDLVPTPLKDEVFFLQESNRPDEYMPAFEDEHGTYIMNSKDLRAIQHVHELTKIGVDSLKIEGRTKSFYYVAKTAQLYRQAIDDACNGRAFDPDLMYQLEGLAHRGYTDGFLKRHSHGDYQNHDYGYSISTTQQFVGEFTGNLVAGKAEIKVKNKFSVGDNVTICSPEQNINLTIEKLVNKKHESVEAGLGDGHVVYLDVPQDINLNYALLVRNLTSGESTRKPHKA